MLRIYGTNIGVDLQATYLQWSRLHSLAASSTLVLLPLNVSRPNQVVLVYNSLSSECTSARVRASAHVPMATVRIIVTYRALFGATLHA